MAGQPIPDINEESVNAVLNKDGEVFTLRKYPNGNIQASFTNLGNVGPYDVCCFLKQAGENLVIAGLVKNANDAIRLSWNTGKKDENGNDVWKPFPQIWVNQPSEMENQTSENTEKVEKLETEVLELKDVARALLARLEERESTPTDPKPVVAKAKKQLQQLPEATEQEVF
ncbi:hypothetical protein CMI37_37530 [Candidatus Pacearchaeota archaeon]|nr:hypothetical protein [Candidatus Pacearchaeota archaeon]|tara:strand:+ start:2730 stop:3242 length:513 start_codon:yes stop_codon:yes gene_type:complete